MKVKTKIRKIMKKKRSKILQMEIRITTTAAATTTTIIIITTITTSQVPAEEEEGAHTVLGILKQKRNANCQDFHS